MNAATTVAEFAGLGPGIAWIDSTSYLFQFLGMATTSLYANALVRRRGGARIRWW